MLNLLRFQKICPHVTSYLKIKTKLMTFDDVGAKETIFNEFYCRTKHRNCSMIYFNQNLFALDRQSVEEICNLFILFEQRGNSVNLIHREFYNDREFTYTTFAD